MKRILLALCAIVACASSAAAQHQRLFAKTSSEIIEFDTNVQSLGTIVRRTPLPPHSANFGVVATAGGRYLAWIVTLPQPGIALFNIQSGATTFVPVANATGIVAADTMRLRLIVEGRDNTGHRNLIIVDGPQLSTRTLDLAPYEFLSRISYASGPGLIAGVVSSTRTPGVFQLAVYDAATATHVRDVELSFYPSSVVSDESAQHVVVQGYSTRLPVELQFTVIDATSGRLIASRQIPRATFVVDFVSGPVIDEERRRVILSNTEGLLALSLDSLDIIGRTDEPRLHLERVPPGWSYPFHVILHCCAPGGPLFTFDQTTVYRGYFGREYLGDAGLSAFDPATGRMLARTTLDYAIGEQSFGIGATVLVPSPKAPVMTSTVNGRSVTLSWTSPPTSTHFEVEVGPAPGLRDLGVIVIGTTSIASDAVPSGTYYVRVRALNDAAKGPYSNEVRIVTP